jgi:arginase
LLLPIVLHTYAPSSRLSTRRNLQLKASSSDLKLTFLSFPSSLEQTGPLQLIESGVIQDIESLGWAVDFAGVDTVVSPLVGASDKPDPDIGILKKPRLVSEVRLSPHNAIFCSNTDKDARMSVWNAQVNQEVAKRVYEHSSKGQLTITLGGDHSLVR